MAFSDGALTLDTVEDIFSRQHWHYEIVQEHILTNFDGVALLISVDEEREIVLLQAPILPGADMPGSISARPDAEMNACIYLLSANYRLALGAFTRDYRDGEIRFEVNLLTLGSLLSDEQMYSAILIAVAAVTHHAPVIFALLTSSMPLRQALLHLESGMGLPPAQAV